MKVFCWKPTCFNRLTNFGDELGPVIVAKLLGFQPQIVTSDQWKDNKEEDRFLSIGSTIEWACARNVIWGTGIRTFQWPGYPIDIRAVRGPLTRLYLKDKGAAVPEIYGDPALLVPQLFPDIPDSEPLKVCVVKHVEEKNTGDVHGTTEVFEAISKIKSAKYVESSSLHGLILADAYGIPSRWIPGPEPELKFQDYFLSTGRFILKPGDELPPPKLPDLNRLIAAFPHEVFFTR